MYIQALSKEYIYVYVCVCIIQFACPYILEVVRKCLLKVASIYISETFHLVNYTMMQLLYLTVGSKVLVIHTHYRP